MTKPDEELAFRVRFAQRLKDELDRTGGMAKDVATSLGLSPRIFYRRLAAETPFTAFEQATLCRRYHISTAELWPAASPRISFEVPVALDAPFEKTAYLARLQAAVHDRREATVTRGRIVSSHVPYLYLYGQPALALLVLYLYELPSQRNSIRPLALAAAQKAHGDWLAATAAMHRDWLQVDSDELWGQAPFDYFVARLEALADRGLLASPSDAEALFVALEVVVEGFATCLPAGRKPERGAALSVGRDWSASANNVLLLEGPGLRSMMLTFSNASFLSSSQPDAIHLFTRYFEASKRLAESVSGRASTVQQFVHEVRQRIAVGRRRVAASFGSDAAKEYAQGR